MMRGKGVKNPTLREGKMLLPDGRSLVNLTPHDVQVHLPGGQRVNIPPSGRVLRVVEHTRYQGEIIGVPIESKILGEIKGDVPPMIPGVFYITSSIVAQVARRGDFLIPSPVRDEAGRVIGARGFFIIGSLAKEEDVGFISSVE